MLPITSPLITSCRKSSIESAGLPLLDGGRQLPDMQGGLDARRLAVLEPDGGVDHYLRPVAIEGGDHLRVALLDESAPHLAGAGELLVVRVQLLVEEHELVD